MEDLSRSYWIARKHVLWTGGLVGFAAVALFMKLPGASRGTALVPLVVMAIFCSPFTLRTAVGRLWWASYVAGIGSGAVAVLLGGHNPLSWVFAVIAGCAYAIGVCLRWYPPTAGQSVRPPT